MKKEYTNRYDRNGERIPYGAAIDLTIWTYPGNHIFAKIEDLHFVAKIRKCKTGDIFEFIKDDKGNDCHFTHKVS